MESTEFAISGVQATGAGERGDSFEQLYINLREFENRIYSDDELISLPDISPVHVHFKEWQIRKQSAKKLISRLSIKKETLHILEVGCGNGWLSNQLSTIPDSRVTGLDINLTELKQAKKVFGRNTRLEFYYGDLRSEILNQTQFDVIVFAASVQYFRSFPEILIRALSHLNTQGEIHIVDSPFYEENELIAAKERTADYYSSFGLPEMKNYYFHHGLRELKGFNHKFLYSPRSLGNKIFKNSNPFPWVCIQKY